MERIRLRPTLPEALLFNCLHQTQKTQVQELANFSRQNHKEQTCWTKVQKCFHTFKWWHYLLALQPHPNNPQWFMNWRESNPHPHKPSSSDGKHQRSHPAGSQSFQTLFLQDPITIYSQANHTCSQYACCVLRYRLPSVPWPHIPTITSINTLIIP